MLYKSYTWRDDFYRPYESLWSLIQKFCMLNSISEADFHKDLCNKIGYSTVKLQAFSPYHIYRMTSLSKSNINKALNITEKNFEVLNCFSVNNLETYMHKDLFYCTICMKYGYHSMFHQLKFLNNCFIHEKQSLIKAPNQLYAILLSRKKPYEGLDVLPNANDIVSNKDLLLKDLINFSLKLPESIRVIDPDYKKYHHPEVTDLNKSTIKLVYSIMFSNIKQQPIKKISVKNNNMNFNRKINYYHKKYNYYFNINDETYRRIHYPSVYLAIHDYVRKLMSDLSVDDIHRIGYNLRHNEVQFGKDDQKYIAFLTASAFLCTVKAENFIHLKRMWPYDKNYADLAYYVDLFNLQYEQLTRNSLKYHYVLKIIFERIADKVNKQFRKYFHEQFSQLIEDPLFFNYKFRIPQFVVTFSDKVFKIYECD